MMHCFHCTVHTRSTSDLHILQNIVNSIFASKFYWSESSRLPTHRHQIIWSITGVQIRDMTPCTTRGPPKWWRLNNFSIFLSCSWWESHRLWPVWSSVSEGRCSRGPPADPHRCDTNTNPHCTHQTHSNALHSVYAACHCMYKFGFEGPHVFTFNKRN